MALDYDKVIATKQLDLDWEYTDRDSMLYAQSIGMGRDPVDRKELDYVYEQGASMRTVPTLATAVVPNMFPPDLGWDFGQVLHIEHRLQLYRPMPPAAKLKIDKRVVDIFDRGEKLGAMFFFEVEGRLAKDDTVLFTQNVSVMARGDGGFGGPRGKGLPSHRVPRREPDLWCETDTRVDQALLFRLNGDRNPLHADPDAAAQAGFEIPILHGLCTYGVACHAVLKTICDYDHTLIEAFDARFSQPVMPGETIRTDMWQDGNVVSFQCSVPKRDVLVLRNGRCVLKG
ncbi:MAG: MaoC/PaaZ C-terminal domain-containing protein [Pseudomonadota bacterium]